MTLFRAILAGAVLLLTSACASTPAPSANGPAANVAGTWQGTWDAGGGKNGFMRVVLEQDGTRIRGNSSIGGFAGYGGAFEGFVEGNRVRITNSNGSGGLELTVNGEEMQGYTLQFGNRVLLRRQAP